jgi:hypothetical protein
MRRFWNSSHFSGTVLLSRYSCAFALSLAALLHGSLAPALHAQPRFPDSWVGQWVGTLSTFAPPDSVRNRIRITLEIAREASGTGYTWRSVFNADTIRGVRPYRLLIDDANLGRYIIDESNGVLLDASYVDGVLTSVFQVKSVVLESRYFLRGDTLTHELTWWDAASSRTATGAGANAEGGAEVKSFRVQGMQRSVIVRRWE